jgi:predicted glycoside hydrolase/deacetylase ChbG (UPF0249 family)
MANTPAFEHAVDLARRNPGLATGIHLNLLKGRPLQPAEEVSSLVSNVGIFHTLPRFILRLLLGSINLSEVERELKAQIEKVLTTGLKVTHLDSHRHFHIYPSILRIVIRLAKKYKIDRIRCPLVTSVFPYSLKELALRGLSRRALGMLKENKIRHNEKFFDLLKVERRNDFLSAFTDFCENIPSGITELDCHPGFITEELDGIEATIHNRDLQIEILTNPDIRGLLQRHSIKLISYRDI